MNNDKSKENKPGGPEDRLRGGTVTVKVDDEKVKVETVDGEADVGDIIKAAGGNPAKDELGILGKGGRFKAGQKIKVHDGMDFSLFEQGPTPVS